jgi:hypothetical protein
VIKLLRFKDVLYTNGTTGFIVSLEDGCFALINTENGHVDVDVFLETYLKWGGFDKVDASDKIELIKKVLEQPKKIYISSLATGYLESAETKNEIDTLKKNIGYNF